MKKVLSLFLILALCICLTGCKGNGIEVNKATTIDADNIKITILGSENVNIKDDDLSIRNGKFTKIKMTIENTGEETYSWTAVSFQFGDDILALNALTFDDVITNVIQPGESATGYIYFPQNGSKTLKYVTNFQADGDGAVAEQYEFNIK